MKWETVTKILGAGGGLVLGFFGGWDVLLNALIVFMCIDYATGLLVAAYHKSKKSEDGGVSSKASFKGLMKKAVMLLVVIMATYLDVLFEHMGFTAAVARTGVITYLLVNEGISVLENVAVFDLNIPILKDLLEKFKGKVESGK